MSEKFLLGVWLEGMSQLLRKESKVFEESKHYLEKISTFSTFKTFIKNFLEWRNFCKSPNI